MKLSLAQINGAKAENIAEAYLKKQGLMLVTKNFRCKQGEIDLIMQEKEMIIFVEVRHRTSTNYGTAAETITLSKQKKIAKTAILFMMQQHWHDKKSMRFDVITLQGQLHADPQINWIKQAFFSLS